MRDKPLFSILLVPTDETRGLEFQVSTASHFDDETY